jgi:hypothetical protein
MASPPVIAAINGAAPDPLDAHRSDSLAMFYTSIGDGKEGVAAFRERRSPDFAGRASQLPIIFEPLSTPGGDTWPRPCRCRANTPHIVVGSARDYHDKYDGIALEPPRDQRTDR